MSRPLGVPRPSKEQIRHGLDVARLRAPLALPTVLVGLGGGVIGAVYLWALRELTDLIGPGERAVLPQALILVAVGITVTLIERSLGDTGNVELLVDNIHVLGGAEDIKRVRPLVPSSLLCIAAGGGMGPEAPLVQANGSFGTWVATKLHLASQDMRVISITGMAAGFTVLFGAPLGSALFALEILHRRGLQYYEALIPAVVGSLCGYVVYLSLSGAGIGPVWTFPPVGTLHVVDLLLAVVVGLAGALGAGLFTAVTQAFRRVLGVAPVWLRYVLGGLALGLLGAWSPYALTFGETQISGLLTTHLAAGALGIALAAKLLGTTVTLASGWKGGFIIPLFFMGAVGGQLAHLAMPGTNQAVLMATAMVALCVGVTKTPLGTTLVVPEMAGLPLLPVTSIAAIVAILVANRVSLIETQRERLVASSVDSAHETVSVGDGGGC